MIAQTAITPEHAASLMQGATPLQIVLLILLGALILLGIYYGVERIISMRVKPLENIPGKLEQIAEGITDIKIKQAEMSGKLWTDEQLDEKIESKINKHQLDCCKRKECK